MLTFSCAQRAAVAVSRALAVSEGRYGSAADLRLNYVQMLLGKHAPKHAPACTTEEGFFPPFSVPLELEAGPWERVSRSLAVMLHYRRR